VKSLFPQIRVHFTEEGRERAVTVLASDALRPEASSANYRPIQSNVLYGGYVRINDEGYYKTLYINTLMPHDPRTNKPFFLQTVTQESWVLILVKTLAKYFGSYDRLRTTKLKDLATALFGAEPLELGEEVRSAYA
jgi:hypothetical protein